MTFVFPRGPFTGQPVSSPRIRTGQLQSLYDRLDKAAWPEDAAAIKAELERRAKMDADDVLSSAEAEALRPKRAVVPTTPNMPLPCGHPLSDLCWDSEDGILGTTHCVGCEALAKLRSAFLTIGNLAPDTIDAIMGAIQGYEVALRRRIAGDTAG